MILRLLSFNFLLAQFQVLKCLVNQLFDIGTHSVWIHPLPVVEESVAVADGFRLEATSIIQEGVLFFGVFATDVNCVQKFAGAWGHHVIEMRLLCSTEVCIFESCDELLDGAVLR